MLEEIPSTNTYALQLAESGTPHGTVVITDTQTAGRGRLRRQWFSPRRSNIYCSAILTQKPASHLLSWIPLVTGLAIVNTVEHHSDLRVSLKWPNDIIIEDKKLGGVLCESTQHAQHGWAVAVGIGLNVNIEMEDLPLELRETATSFSIEGQAVQDRHRVIATLLNQLEIWQDYLLSGNVSQLRTAYLSRCSSIRRQVRIHLMNGDVLEGFAQDISKEGALRIDSSTCPPSTHKESSSPSTTREIRAGDVVHLR